MGNKHQTRFTSTGRTCYLLSYIKVCRVREINGNWYKHIKQKENQIRVNSSIYDLEEYVCQMTR